MDFEERKKVDLFFETWIKLFAPSLMGVNRNLVSLVVAFFDAGTSNTIP